MSTESMSPEPSCAVGPVLRRIGDKWSPAVIRLLATRPHGFNEPDRGVHGISRRMLTRTLEDEGFVSRTIRPGRVEYAPTELGRSLREQLFALGLWAAAHDAEIRRRSSRRPR
jgi:DNA-binding HxlR family transcriptional regulator